LKVSSASCWFLLYGSRMLFIRSLWKQKRIW